MAWPAGCPWLFTGAVWQHHAQVVRILQLVASLAMENNYPGEKEVVITWWEWIKVPGEDWCGCLWKQFIPLTCTSAPSHLSVLQLWIHLDFFFSFSLSTPSLVTRVSFHKILDNLLFFNPDCNGSFSLYIHWSLNALFKSWTWQPWRSCPTLMIVWNCQETAQGMFTG